MQIRPSTTEDAEQIAACVGTVARERRWLASVEAFGVDQTRRFLAHLDETGGIHLVAVDRTEIVGWCDVVRYHSPGMAHTGRLGIGLLPGYRDRGLGGPLLIRTLEAAFGAGFRRIELEVFASNERALKLYLRHGFRVEGRKVGAWELDGRSDDLLLLGLLKPA
jgi:RimJ/RimL family protein N-acetyltransferase